MKNFYFYMPTKIVFGKGALYKLSEQTLPGKKALIVTGGNSVKKFGYLQRTIDELLKAGVESAVYDGITPNPTKDEVHEGAAMAKDFGASFIVGLGGGSAIDASKAIAIMANNPGDYWDYINGGTGKGMPIPNKPLPVVAITTTAGTGTEVDPWMVVTKTETNEKIGSGSENNFPIIAIVDPELMSTVPPRLTAYQGFDALFHSTEGVLNVNSTEMSDLYALEAIRLIGKSLPEAIKNGKNLDARADVALANTLSGINEYCSGCISEHSLAHAAGAYHPNLEHGAALTAISVAYYTYMAKSGKCDDKMIAMAKALGRTDADSAIDFVEALAQLIKDCGVDDIKLSEYGMRYEELDKYVKNAKDTMGGLFGCDPVEVTDEAALEILQKSYK